METPGPLPMPDAAADDIPRDPRRWLTLSILLMTIVLIALDTSVLNVSIPTMLRDLDTTVPALQWVITGYSLTFGSLLIIGGRLGDIYGHRRLFIIGTSLFGTGSLVAALSTSVGMLIFGEAVIEGIGAALMTPATLAILSTTFTGKERNTAFAAWGAAAGAAVAFGPVIGGFLTTNYSWRWAFGMNVIIAPIAALGALLLIRPGPRIPRRPIDLPGAALITSATFLMVFALSDGGTFGWFEPLRPFSVAGVEIWPDSAPISIVPLAILAAAGLVCAFVHVERRKGRQHADPLFDLTLLEIRSFRYGLLTALILAMGQLALLFALPLFLQDAVHLSAQENGLWLLPIGVAVIIGAQLGGRLTRVMAIGRIITMGLTIETISLGLVIWAVHPGITFWQILPGLVGFGIGIGFASSQLTSVILSEVNGERSGVASGASSTARQIGGAFGAAVVGSLITVQFTNRAASEIGRAGLDTTLRERTVDTVRDLGPSARPSSGIASADAAAIERIFTDSLAFATRTALGFALIVVCAGAFLSLLIPRVHPRRASLAVETVDALGPLDVDVAPL